MNSVEGVHVETIRNESFQTIYLFHPTPLDEVLH